LIIQPYSEVGDPFAEEGGLGELCLDSAGGYFYSSFRLQREDFQATGSEGSCATINDDGWYEFSVEASAIDDSGWSQFRVFFTLDDNDNRRDDYLMFYGGYAGASAPVLEIEYLP